MKIRIKVKHLVLYVLLPLIVLAAAAIWTPTAIERYQASRTPEALRLKTLEEIEQASSKRKLELIVQEAIRPSRYDLYRFDYQPGGNRLMVASEDTEETGFLTPEDRLPLLERYIREGEDEALLIRAARQLAYEYGALGRSEDGEKALKQTFDRMQPGSQGRLELLLDRAEYALNQNDADKAEGLFEQLRKQTGSRGADLNTRTDRISSQILFAQGRPEQAATRAGSNLHSGTPIPRFVSPSPSPSSADSNHSKPESELMLYRNLLERALSRGTTSPASFSGTLTYGDGTPVVRAGLFLRSEKDPGPVREGEPYRTVTDQNGRFDIRNVVPGSYVLELGLDFDQLDGWSWPVQAKDWMVEIGDGQHVEYPIVIQPLIELQSPVNDQEITGDTIDFSWSPIEGAAYYDVIGSIPDQDGNAYVGTAIRNRIPENRLSLTLNELYGTSGGLTMPDDGSWEDTDPNRLLAYMNPDARFSWNVSAYDAEGRIISQSGGYRLSEDNVGNMPFFHVRQRSLTEADRLLLDGKLEQALQLYRRNIDIDPQDTESLYMAIRLLNAKFEIGGDIEAQSEEAELRKRLPNSDSP